MIILNYVSTYSIDHYLYISFWHPQKTHESYNKTEMMDAAELVGGRVDVHFPSRFKKSIHLKGILEPLSFPFPDMKNENYKGDNNKNSRMSGQAGAVHYSQLLWAAW